MGWRSPQDEADKASAPAIPLHIQRNPLSALDTRNFLDDLIVV
jgi:hypothetical protein